MQIDPSMSHADVPMHSSCGQLGSRALIPLLVSVAPGNAEFSDTLTPPYLDVGIAMVTTRWLRVIDLMVVVVWLCWARWSPTCRSPERTQPSPSTEKGVLR